MRGPELVKCRFAGPPKPVFLFANLFCFPSNVERSGVGESSSNDLTKSSYTAAVSARSRARLASASAFWRSKSDFLAGADSFDETSGKALDLELSAMLTRLQEQQADLQGCRKIELGCQMSSLNLYAATVRESKAIWDGLAAEAEELLLP
jgi:hypothetical protein